MDKKKFFILDGSSLLYRAFYALPLLESASGIYTNAIVGFSNMLVKLMKDWQPDSLVIAFDKSKKTFRTEMFAEYKGTRKPMPDELRSQVAILHEMAEAWHIPLVELEGYEADDIIGTLANRAVENGMAAYVVTGDRDALQLVKKDLTVLFTKKGISELSVYDDAVFEAEYEGLSPIQLIDLKGLMGDTSDNIPGVPKVGPKTAMKLIAAYGTVEEVLLHIEEVAGKALKERLRDNQEQALLSKRLATININVPVEFKADEFAISLEARSLTDFYNKYSMRSMLKHIPKLTEATSNSALAENSSQSAKPMLVMPAVQKVEDIEDGKILSEKAVKAGSVYIMPQFTGKVPHKKLQAMAICIQGKNGAELFYIPAGAESNEAGMADLFSLENEEINPAWDAICDILHDEKIVKYLYDAKGFYQSNMQLAGKVYDLELVGYLLNPSVNKYAVSDLAERYDFGGELDLTSELDADILSHDVFVLTDIADKMVDKLSDLGMTLLYDTIEYPLARVLASMEQNGIALNSDKLKEQTQRAGEIIAALEQEIYQLAGREFNISSPKQLGAVLFADLKLPVIKKTKTGYSTNVEVLNELYNLHPIIEKVLNYRQWTKLKSTYLDGIAPLIDDDTERVHTTFNQTVTATGRLSSSDPNLQNIPVRSEEGKHIRELFEPGADYDLLLSADYSQIELRVLADMSQDASFLKAFRKNEDIHARTAAEVFGISIEEVNADLRRKAKAVNFGIVYGISDFGLAQDLHIAKSEAKEYIEKYFAKCQGVKAFIDTTVKEAKRKGFVATKYGRRRSLPAINSSNFNQRSLAERMAMNTPIQGTAADIIKLAMIRAYAALQKAKLKSRILLQVHDELVLEVVNEELDKVKTILTEAMEQAVKLSVPLTIDINTGKNWAEAK